MEDELCAPATMYGVLGMVSMVAMLFMNLGGTGTSLIARAAAVALWTVLLQVVCDAGGEIIAWILVAPPFIAELVAIVHSE